MICRKEAKCDYIGTADEGAALSMPGETFDGVRAYAPNDDIKSKVAKFV